MVAGACSPVDRMCVTPKPAIATLFMAGHHSKTDSIGLQYQSECCCEQEDHHKHPATLSKHPTQKLGFRESLGIAR